MTQVQDDPFARLENELRRTAAEEAGAKAMGDARARLVLSKDVGTVFFTTIALNLRPEPAWGIETAATDGKVLKYHPEWFAGLPTDQALGVIVHEVMHVAMKHHARQGARNPRKWNEAIDLAQNSLIRESGFKLPPGGLFPGEGPYRDIPAGLSAEEIYPLLPDPPEGEGEGDGDGQGNDPGGCGGVMPPGDNSQAACQQAEDEAEVLVAQAEQMAKRRGSLPAGLARLVGELMKPKVDWRKVLRDFITRQSKSDYAWLPPNRRFVAQGLYLPSLRGEELGDVVCLVDTSGSIGPKELNVFASEMQGILEAYDCTLTIIYHDHDVQGVETWKSGDGPLRLNPKGGGGTSHVPVFAHIDAMDEEPACVVCLTDLYSQFPSEPRYPVLWATVGAGGQKAPWGVQVEVE